jgi:uncharacterized protein (DUF924 family)
MRPMKTYAAGEVLEFWFPQPRPKDHASMVVQQEWWFRGGADAQILARFVPLHTAAANGDLDGWARTSRGRLALILVFDQFSRTIHRNTAAMYAQDAKARMLAREGLALGHYDALADAWEKTFFLLAFGHSEDLADLDRAVELAEQLVSAAPPEQKRMLEFSANQARSHREVIRRFGRQPHRNALLGRISTPAEIAYLSRNELVHQRAIPR